MKVRFGHEIAVNGRLQRISYGERVIQHTAGIYRGLPPGVYQPLANVVGKTGANKH